MRAACDECGEVTDDARPARVSLKQEIVCRTCRIELGVAFQDDLEAEQATDDFARERERIQYHGG